MKFIRVAQDQQNKDIQHVYLTRPEVKNAFHPEMISEMTQFFKSVDNKKCIILRGEGTAFCAGADLNWMKQMVNYSFDENLKDSEKLWEMFESVMNCPAVVVGVAHGAVFGGALGLLAVCDYVLAETNTNFCFSEVKLGLAPAVISSFILRKCNASLVRAFMLSAEIFNTEKAKQIGLVHKSYSNKIEDSEIMEIAAKNGMEGMLATKKLLNQLEQNPTWSEQKTLTTRVISERRLGQEAQVRLKKFLEKS